MLLGGWRRLPHVLREARRRKVYTAAVAYGAVSVVLIQIGHAVFVDALLLPEWTPRLLTVLLILGFPIVLVLAWIFDIGPEGVRRTEAAEAQVAGGAGPVRVGPAPPPVSTPQMAPPARALRIAVSTAAPNELSDEVAERRTPVGEAEPPADEPVVEAPEPERVRRAALAHARHELRTPINAIIGYAEMLLEDAEETGDAETAADLRRIREGGRELLSLVDSILDPDEVARDAGRDLESYGARIRADLRTPATTVIGYAELLLESGHGDMAADLERILNAARRLLELSSDIVQVATRTETGSTDALGGGFAGVSAMTRDVLSKIRPVRPGNGEADERHGSLLVIDDNAFNRDLLARQLARKGYMVATAESGLEGLDRLQGEDYDLVLLDILMPELDGVEVLRRIQADSRLRGVPVVMISSLDEIDSAIRCLELGAADYLTKPFHPTLLDARIGAVLEIRRMREREARRRIEVEETDALTLRLALGGCPPSIANRIRAGETGIREQYPETTVLWCDLGRSMRRGPRPDPVERIQLLERAYACVESVARDHGLDTVLLFGTCVLVAGGIPSPIPDHAQRVAATALDALTALSGEHGGPAPDATTGYAGAGVPPALGATRFGLHTGAAFGAVLNADRLAYHVWGDAVDLARRLEAHAEPATIHVSPATHALLKDRFEFTRRGVVEVAERGQMQTYLLAGRSVAPAGG